MQFGRENKSPDLVERLNYSKRMAEKEERYAALRREHSLEHRLRLFWRRLCGRAF